MRSLSGVKAPDKIADPIIVHPDVRRLLLTQKAFAEGGRAMAYYVAKLVDDLEQSTDEEVKAKADGRLGFLTPILKAFLTEVGLEAASNGMQVFGGHGYIKEWGMEQTYRDARIATLYEGTTGIQALDLLGRKVLLNRAKEMNSFAKEILVFCKDHSVVSGDDQKMRMHKFVWPLAKVVAQWQQYTIRLMLKGKKDRDIVGSASTDYLMYSGYITMAYFWAMQAQAANEKLTTGEGDKTFYKGKVKTAEFYFERILPRTKALAKTMMEDPKSLMQMSEEMF